MNLSADDVSERFSRGLTEDLTSLLAREPQLRVASRTRMTRYGHGQAEAGRIGREPGVRAVLEGSVRREGVLYENREFDQAITEARTASILTNQMPVFSLTFWLRGLALEGQGRFAEAEEVFREALIHQPHDPLIEPSLGHLLARTGRKMEAESVLAELRAQVERGRLTYTAQAIVLAGLGRNEEALRALEEGLAHLDDSLLAAPRDPRLQTLRSDPRFQAVVSRMTGGAMSTV